MTMKQNHLDKIDLGTWAFGGCAYGPMDDHVATAICDRARRSDIHLFDMANTYTGGGH